MSRRKLLLLFTMLVLAGGVAAHLAYKERIEQRQLIALEKPLTTAFNIKIPRGTSLAGIAELVAANAPVSKREFIALAHRLNVASSLQAGTYHFSSGETVEAVLRNMAAGKVHMERITLIEGRTYTDILAQLAQDQRLSQQLPTMSTDDVRRALNIEQKNLEGLFLPETYFFEPGSSDLSILRRAHRRLKKTLDTHWKNRKDKGALKTPYEALILASIVEKETGKASERPLIASVFTNRLLAGIRLQADPTVIYGLGDRFNGNLTRRHLREKTPYNTYVRAGLTPTPIALAGEAAIVAALNPTDSDYYYFVATGDGGHYFSKNLREHNNAVNRYQRRRK